MPEQTVLKSDHVSEPINKRDRDNVKDPPAWFKKHESVHNSSSLFPKKVPKSIDSGNANKMHPPPPHMRIAEETPFRNRIGLRLQKFQIEQRFSQPKLCPQDRDISERRHQKDVRQRDGPLKMNN